MIRTDIYTLLYLKQITNKNLLCCPGNSPQYCVMAYMGKESKKSGYIYVCVCVCVTDSLGCTPEATQHCKSTTLQ